MMRAAGELKRLLTLSDAGEAAALIPAGWPRDRFGPARRRRLSEVACLDRLGTPVPEAD